MAHPDSFVAGAIFFLVHYYDEELLFPSIQTLEYESRATADDGTALWIFREPNGTQDAETDEPDGIAFAESQLYELLDFDGLLRVIREQQVGEGKSRIRGAHIAPDELLKKYGMRERVAAFLSSEASSLSLEVRYTDDGMFIEKTADGAEFHFFTHPLRYSEQNSRMNGLLESKAWTPREDYLADKGRTRVLSIPCPGVLPRSRSSAHRSSRPSMRCGPAMNCRSAWVGARTSALAKLLPALVTGRCTVRHRGRVDDHRGRNELVRWIHLAHMLRALVRIQPQCISR